MMNRILIIDGNNLAHRAQHKFNLTTTEGKPSSVVYGFIYILASLIRRFPSDQVYCVFDGGRSEYRKTLLPTYKARENRFEEGEYEEFISQLEFLYEHLPLANCRTIKERGQEADDIIFEIVRKYPNSYRTIVSSDKDFIQLLRPNVKIFNPFKDTIITHTNALKECGYSPKECVDYLTLDGDKSDKIPGVPGMGPKRIREFLDTFGSIQGFLEEYETEGVDAKWARYIPDIIKVKDINRKLISLTSFYLTTGRSIFHTPKGPKGDFKTLSSILLKEYQIRLFTNPDFHKPFKNLK